MDSFSYIINILENSTNEIASECLKKIYNERILFYPGILKEKEEIESLYRLRLQIAKDHDKDRFRGKELSNWSTAMRQLSEIDCNQIRMAIIQTEEKSYLIFVNVDKGNLASILFLYPKNTLKDREEQSIKMKEQGYSSSTLVYLRGQPINFDDIV